MAKQKVTREQMFMDKAAGAFISLRELVDWCDREYPQGRAVLEDVVAHLDKKTTEPRPTKAAKKAKNAPSPAAVR